MKHAKRLCSVILAGAMAFSLAACQNADTEPEQTPVTVQEQTTPAPTEEPAAAAGFAAGTYEGEAQGMEGTIKVSVTLSAEKIEEIKVLESSETPTIGEVALESLPGAVVAAQSTQIDGISGATVTSDAFFEAVNAALVSAGVDPSALTPVVSQDAASAETEELTCDVVVVGAGGAGMTAALKADEQGFDVIVLEKQAFVGGATAMSSGNFVACGSKYQQIQGIEDSPEEFFLFLMKNGDFQNDGTPAWLLASCSGRAADWLDDAMGLDIPDEMRGVRGRYHAQGGAGMMQDFYQIVQSKNIPVMLNTRAYQLTDTDGRVDGVLARDVNTGKEYVIKAGAVLLATGGYCCDDDYIGEDYANFVLSGSSANTGDGIDMALPYGAVLQNMDCVAMSGSGINKGNIGQHTKGASEAVYAQTGAILVNQDGVRFANEAYSNPDMVEKMCTHEHTYLLLDQAAFDIYSESCISNKYYTQEQQDQWLAENGTGVTVFAHGETLADVANVVGMDAAALEATVERYNSLVAAGEDTDFGHPVSAPIGEGPYYLVEQVVRYSTTLGGLTINGKLQIVNQVNKPIEGLYAAGELIGGVHGANFPNACGVGWALTSGMLAGEAIVEYLGE